MTRNPLTTRYLREFIPAMAGYVIVLPLSIALLLKVETQQRIELQALVITCALIGIAPFSVVFLQNVRLLPSPPWLLLWILPLMIGTYGMARALVTRRYR